MPVDLAGVRELEHISCLACELSKEGNAETERKSSLVNILKFGFFGAFLRKEAGCNASLVVILWL